MQLMCDAITVLGSRHGLLLDPVGQQCQMIRFDSFQQLPPFQLRAGAIINGREYRFPFCRDGERFAFFDQRITPCTSRFIAIEPDSGVKVTLTFATPFRPRDAEFSTMPVIGIRLEAERIAGNFRWTRVTVPPETVELFFEIEGLSVEAAGAQALDVRFASTELPQHDRIVGTAGELVGHRFSGPRLELGWCTHSGPVLEIRKRRQPFKYTTRFADLAAVSDWARRHVPDIFDNARCVDGVVADNNQSKSINDLLAYTLHSWLANTWWVERDGRDWFSVWEGICHFHSTVDVEFTQSPFYLAVWPELLAIELDLWTEFSKDGGNGTLFLSHDVGQLSRADGQVYPHEMEVEETTNYVILLYAHWRRTGDFSLAKAKRAFVEKYLAFLVACDTTGNGVPDRGIANTIDDASPAIQYGREQVYLAVKTLATFTCGAAILRHAGDTELAANYAQRAGMVRDVIERNGWKDDHYVTLLDKRTAGVVNPWTGATLTSDEVPGWDGYHIYTANALAVLDMVGLDLGLNRDRLVTDLRTATARCLREYGCAHTDYTAADHGGIEEGMVGVGGNPGWISMNMLRDIAAAYRGVDLRALTDRYWQWQVTCNTQAPALFFETFGGNNLCFYPRGVAIWGFFDALAGRVIDRGADRDRSASAFPDIRVPRFLDANWRAS